MACKLTTISEGADPRPVAGERGEGTRGLPVGTPKVGGVTPEPGDEEPGAAPQQ